MKSDLSKPNHSEELFDHSSPSMCLQFVVWRRSDNDEAVVGVPVHKAKQIGFNYWAFTQMCLERLRVIRQN